MSETDINLDIADKKLTEEAAGDDLLEIEKPGSHYPDICYRAKLIMNGGTWIGSANKQSGTREGNNERES
jgi:hypothetical protein